MAWRTARSITALHEQLARGAPRSVPPATSPDAWGTIGDVLHDKTSDHVPHNFPGWGSQIVTAGDFPNVPALGLDAFKVLDDIRRARDPRAKYGISNGMIFSSHPVTEHGHAYPAWQWRPYDGTDQHREHGHLSVVGDVRADGTQPWPTIGAPAPDAEDEDDMGASFGPIEIQREGRTSLTIPPVQAGGADPRPAWLNFCNDTGEDYTLRVWSSTGDKNFSAFPGTRGGLLTLASGERWSQEIPKNTACLTISRQPGSPGTPPFAGHLTCAIERGNVIHA